MRQEAAIFDKSVHACERGACVSLAPLGECARHESGTEPAMRCMHVRFLLSTPAFVIRANAIRK
jgi:hypothetical protein